ncbi:MAG: tryptophan--tRNA ligase [Acidobacteriaceae bacterium]
MPPSQNKTNGRIISGMRSTGKLHLGNYMGALHNWVKLQDALATEGNANYDCFFFIADWHALTTDYADTSRVKANTIDVALDWLAAGLDPKRSTLFIQSHVPQHAELHLLFSMITPLSWLERVPSYKEQIENLREKELGTYGFLGYPLLQAADILLYAASGKSPLWVPVGEDQVPHIELSREVARRFNQFYELPQDRSVFPEPQPLLTPSPKVPGTDGRKMSKSYNNAILMSDPEPVIRQKLKTMVTDPARVRRSDPGNPQVCPVYGLHQIFSSAETIRKVEVGCTTAGIGCIECKSWCADGVVAMLNPIQERRREYESQPKLVWEILEDGSRRAGEAAERTMRGVRDAMNMSREYTAAQPRAASGEAQAHG